MVDHGGGTESRYAHLSVAEVQPGMVCTARSVIHGTAISSFDAEVLDNNLLHAISDVTHRFFLSGCRLRIGRIQEIKIDQLLS